MTDSANDFKVAIIGMAGRFPGAGNVMQLWRNLCEGRESVRPFEASSFPKNPRVGYVHAGAPLDDADKFDAAFFRCTPREAQLMDPQHRVFLECAWSAFEDAGYAPASQPGRVGVYAGASFGTYLLRNLASHPEYYRTSALQALMLYGSAVDYLATRISYKLNLTGPSLAVQTACSSSLVAIHMAAEALLGYHCDTALAGGVSIRVPQEEGYEYEDGGLLSSDGHCRPFSSEAGGTVFGSGVGAVVMKRLCDAIRDEDHIYAILLGSAVNNDGGNRVGFTAPSAAGQSAVIHEALEVSGVDARSIGYVEAHGTGTKLGDPIEVAALTTAYRAHTPDVGFCALGSIKGNVGHLNAAAGVTGFIKAVLAVREGKIPTCINLGTPNPHIDFDSTPFRPIASVTPWHEASHPRRAAVSSFGVGGTNAHAIIEQAPESQSRPTTQCPQVLLVSAASAAGADALVDELALRLSESPQIDLRDVAHTLQVGRGRHRHRRALVADTVAEAARGWPQALRRHVEGAALRVAWLLPGRAEMAESVRVLQELVREEPAACTACAEVEGALRAVAGLDLWALAEQGEAGHAPKDSLASACVTFAVEHALSKLWRAWGVRPEALIGEGVGEIVAGHLAGSFSLEDALRFVLAAHADAAAVQSARHADLSGIVLSAATTPVISGRTSDWLRAEQTCDPRYWVGRLHSPVDITAAAERVLQSGPAVFLDIGPSSALIRRLGMPSECAIQSVNAFDAGGLVARQLRTAVAQLWLAGIEPEWKEIRRGEPARRVPLPTYPFARDRHWIEPRLIEGDAFASVVSPLDFKWEADNGRQADTCNERQAKACGEYDGLATSAASSPADEDPVGKTITRIFAELLGVPEVQREVSFFELGGDSLLATQVLTRIREEFSVELPVSKVFAAPTVQGLVDLVELEFSTKLAEMSAEQIERSLHEQRPELA